MSILVDPLSADDDARRLRGRRPHRLVLDGLHGGRRRGAPLLRLHGAVRVLDAAPGRGGQPAHPAGRLGPRRARLVSPDRLRPPPARRDRGCKEGVRDERGRRRGHGARVLPAHLAHRDARLRAGVPGRRGRPALGHRGHARRARAARRGGGQVGAGADPHVASGRDGGADTGLRAHPRGHDGDRRCLPDLPHAPGVRGGSRPCRTSPRCSGS